MIPWYSPPPPSPSRVNVIACEKCSDAKCILLGAHLATLSSPTGSQPSAFIFNIFTYLRQHHPPPPFFCQIPLECIDLKMWLNRLNISFVLLLQDDYCFNSILPQLRMNVDSNLSKTGWRMEGGCPIISVQIGEPKGGNRPDKAAFSLRQSIVGKQRAQYRAISLASAPPHPLLKKRWISWLVHSSSIDSTPSPGAMFFSWAKSADQSPLSHSIWPI